MSRQSTCLYVLILGSACSSPPRSASTESPTVPVVPIASATQAPDERQPAPGPPRHPLHLNEVSTLNLTVRITADGIFVRTSAGEVATGCARLGDSITVPKLPSGQHNYDELGRCARHLKERNADFADETQVNVTAHPNVIYQSIIDVMDVLRGVDGDLFPDVHFGVAR